MQHCFLFDPQKMFDLCFMDFLVASFRLNAFPLPFKANGFISTFWMESLILSLSNISLCKTWWKAFFSIGIIGPCTLFMFVLFEYASKGLLWLYSLSIFWTFLLLLSPYKVFLLLKQSHPSFSASYVKLPYFRFNSSTFPDSLFCLLSVNNFFLPL